VQTSSNITLFITDEQGRSIGYRGDEFVDEIPGGVATPVIDNNDFSLTGQNYYLPLQPYEITIIIAEPGVYTLSLFTGDTVFTFTAEAFAPDTTSLSWISSQEPVTIVPAGAQHFQKIKLCKIMESGEEERTCEINIAEPFQGEGFSLQADAQLDSLRFQNNGLPNGIHLILKQLTSTGVNIFGSNVIWPMQENSAIIVTPEDWTFPQGEDVRVDVDLEADGSIDYTTVYSVVFFERGDANTDCSLDITDAIHSLAYLFAEGTEALCLDCADTNDDGAIDITDPIMTLSYLFAGGEYPPDPFNYRGIDETMDTLTCNEYPICTTQ
jgi:hypothetical protein